MAASRTVFIGGVPGAGKSFLSQQVVRAQSDVRHEVAGRLIRGALGQASGTYSRPIVESGEEADYYQELLIREFLAVREVHEGTVILDGHFVVPTTTAELQIVTADVFRRLGVDVFVLVESRLDVVVGRLRVRDSTAWWDGTSETAAALIKLEREHAAIVSRDLDRTLIRVDGEGIDLARAVAQILLG